MRKILIGAFLFLMLAPVFLQSADAAFPNLGNKSLVTCTGAKVEGSSLPVCTSFCDILNTGKNVLDFAVSIAILIIAPLFIVIGGVIILTGGGNPSKLNAGKSYIMRAIVAVIIIVTVFTLVNTVLTLLFGSGQSFIKGFNQPLECSSQTRNLFIDTAYAAEIVIDTSIPGVEKDASPIGVIAGLYKYALTISGFLAVSVIVYGAIKYAVSSGNSGALGDAREWITSAVLGILLLAGAYLILNTINPDLTILKLPKIVGIDATPSSWNDPCVNNPNGPTCQTSNTKYLLVADQDVLNKQFDSQDACSLRCNEAPVRSQKDYRGQSPVCAQNAQGQGWSCMAVKQVGTSCYYDVEDCQARKSSLGNTFSNPSCATLNENQGEFCKSMIGNKPTPTNPIVGGNKDGGWKGATPPAGTLTHAEALKLLGGITTNYSGVDCQEAGQTNCTSLMGIPKIAIDKVVALKKACGNCNVLITGGTEAGHQTHGMGMAILDLRNTDGLNKYIYSDVTNLKDGDPRSCTWYTGKSGQKYYWEDRGCSPPRTPHWHMSF